MEFDSKHGGLPPINSVNKPAKSYKKLYWSIIAFLFVTNVVILYFYFNHQNKPEEVPVEQNISSSTPSSEHSIDISTVYNVALAKIDQMSLTNAALAQQLNDKTSEIYRLKEEIRVILADKNATRQDLLHARDMIQELNVKVSFYTNEVNKIKKETNEKSKQNTELKKQNEQLTQQNVELNKKLENAQVLHASNIKILPIELKKGGSEIETSRARRVDILRVKFDINENHLIEAGIHTLHLRIIDPEGKLIFNTGSGSGYFNIKNIELEQKFTKSRKIHFSDSEPIKDIIIDWEQSNDYLKGEYIIELYHNGWLIGKAVRQLR